MYVFFILDFIQWSGYNSHSVLGPLLTWPNNIEILKHFQCFHFSFIFCALLYKENKNEWAFNSSAFSVWALLPKPVSKSLTHLFSHTSTIASGFPKFWARWIEYWGILYADDWNRQALHTFDWRRRVWAGRPQFNLNAPTWGSKIFTAHDLFIHKTKLLWKDL